jgi:hypothetical protein
VPDLIAAIFSAAPLVGDAAAYLVHNKEPLMSDPSAAIAAAPIVAVATPYVVQIAIVLIPVAVGWLANELRRHAGVKVQQAALDKIDAWAEAEAGALVAAAADNFATREINVGSPIVAVIASRMAKSLPDDLKAAGLSAADVATIVTGKIGKLQASMTSVAPAVATAATASAKAA